MHQNIGPKPLFYSSQIMKVGGVLLDMKTDVPGNKLQPGTSESLSTNVGPVESLFTSFTNKTIFGLSPVLSLFCHLHFNALHPLTAKTNGHLWVIFPTVKMNSRPKTSLLTFVRTCHAMRMEPLRLIGWSLVGASQADSDN